MISETFIKKMSAFGKQISIRLTFSDGNVYEKDEVFSCNRSFSGDFFKTLMSFVDIEIYGIKDITNQKVNINFGVRVSEDEDYEYVDFGNYIIDNTTIEKSIDKNKTSFTAYDYMIKSCIDYEDLGISYPISVKDYLIVVCEKLGYQLKTETFVNSSKLIEEDKFMNTGSFTFRDVLDHIAGCTGSTIGVKGSNLYLKYPTETGITLDENNLKSLSLNDKWGPVNSLVLSLMPQNDNFHKRDEESIKKNGLTEIKISNNEFMSKKREDFIDELFDYVNGLCFYPFDLDSFGFCVFDPCDVITIRDLEGKEYKSIIFNDDISISSGVNEKIYSVMPESTEIDYSKSTSSEKLLYQTILEVDKTNRRITAEIKEVNTKIDKIGTPGVSPTEPEDPKQGQQWIDISMSPPQYKVYDKGQWVTVGDYTGDLGELEGAINELNTSMNMQQGRIDFLVETNTTTIKGNEVTIKEATEQLLITVDGIENRLSTTGGNNLIKDSMGVYGDGWTGKNYIDKSTGVKDRNIYGFAIMLANSELHQVISVPNGNYTLSFSYAKWIPLADVKLKVNGTEFVLSNNEFTSFIHSFEVNSGTVDITFISDTDYSCTIVNLMLNQGTEPILWSLNSNETWTDTMKMSSSGLTIESSGADVLFNAKADIIGFKNKNTGEYVAIFTDNGAIMKELEVKTKAKIVGLLFQEINGQTVINRIGGDN